MPARHPSAVVVVDPSFHEIYTAEFAVIVDTAAGTGRIVRMIDSAGTDSKSVRVAPINARFALSLATADLEDHRNSYVEDETAAAEDDEADRSRIDSSSDHTSAKERVETRATIDSTQL